MMIDAHDEAKTEAYRRVGALTGPGRPRQWSEETKRRGTLAKDTVSSLVWGRICLARS
jgi:hypothetical protein